jgi:hypothetical protein
MMMMICYKYRVSAGLVHQLTMSYKMLLWCPVFCKMFYFFVFLVLMCELISESAVVSVVTCEGVKFRALSFLHVLYLFSSNIVSVIK